MLKRRTILIPPEFVTMVTISALNEISWGYLLYSIVFSLSLSLPLCIFLYPRYLYAYICPIVYVFRTSSTRHRETEGILTWNKRGWILKFESFERDTSLFLIPSLVYPFVSICTFHSNLREMVIKLIVFFARRI